MGFVAPWHVGSSGIEPVFHALAGGFLTTGLPGQPLNRLLLLLLLLLFFFFFNLFDMYSLCSGLSAKLCTLGARQTCR